MTPLEQYVRILDDLLLRRALESLSDDDEERFAVTLNDCRRAMSPEQEAQIAEIVAARKATAGRASLGSGLARRAAAGGHTIAQAPLKQGRRGEARGKPCSQLP
ncbi:MAG TPA: hypothetical protein VJN18_21980 [Polyangiaceae bacterium]|nr:hypothetical protein [Polyangiaceae bacterium]